MLHNISHPLQSALEAGENIKPSTVGVALGYVVRNVRVNPSAKRVSHD